MIRLFKVAMSSLAKEAVAAVFDSGYIGQGPKVDEFEKALETPDALGRKVLTTNSCTSAIDLALHLCDVGPGDEVLTTAMTCTATNTMLVNRRAKIVWCDVDRYTGCIDPADVARKVTNKTKAIIAVDWAGRLCDFRPLKYHGVPVIEDAAHHYGPDGRAARGDMIAWSFQAIKYLTTADGGALYVPPWEYDRAKLLRWYGLDRTKGDSFRCAQTIEEAGYKYHMNDVAAAIGLANLARAAHNVYQQTCNAVWMTIRLKERKVFVVTPPLADYCSWWLYTIIVDNRDEFIEKMKFRGVECSPVHTRNDKHPAFRGYSGGELPGLDYFAAHEVAIPIGWWLTSEELEKVAQAVEECA